MAEKHGRRVGDILPDVLKRLRVAEKTEEVKLLHEWPEIVGEAVSRRSQPLAVRKGLLVIAVENSAWMQEIRFHQKELLERVRQRHPKLKVKGIRLVLERERDEE
jgi:predicted nucleic acid-binding Zn ribbon protein